MKSILLPAIAATFLLELLSISSRAENNPGDTRRSDAVSSQNKDFVNEVGRGLMRDSALAAIPAQRTRSPDVRIFATRVSAQREQARQRLRQLAGDLRLRLPVRMNDYQRNEIDQLLAAGGADFDRQFLRLIVETKYLRFYRFQLRGGGVRAYTPLQGFAAQQLSTVRRDRNRAREPLRRYR